MNKLSNIFYPGKLDFITPFLKSKSLKRLDDISMHCGLTYTSFPFFSKLKKYSRFTHSINVARIIYNFTNNITQSLSGLFHDISTGCFSHVIDFVYSDYLSQEYSENKTEEFIKNDEIIVSNLNKLNIKIDDISNYHKYPIADNDTPHLSSDRLEYTLSNFYNFHFLSTKEISNIYNDIVICKNERGEDELSFSSVEKAKLFTLNALNNSKIYVSDEDRFTMEKLSLIIKKGLKDNIISEEDLYLKEKELIKRIKNSKLSNKYKEVISFNKVITSIEKKDDTYVKVFAKKRYIDPYIKDKGRLSSLDSEIKKEIESFLNSSQDYYIKGV